MSNNRVGKTTLKHQATIKPLFMEGHHFYVLPIPKYNLQQHCIRFSLLPHQNLLVISPLTHHYTFTINRYQGLIWDLIEHPESSTAANIVSYIAMSFVLISTVVMSLNTMQVISSISSSQSSRNSRHVQGLKVLDKKGNLQPHPFLEIIEAICIAWFTLEFIIR